MTNMTAKLPEKGRSNAKNWSRDKELVQSYNLVAHIGYDPETNQERLREVVTVRCWMGRSKSASVVYASIWVNGPSCWTSGRGSAGGYGYHKISAAVGDAIRSAGIELDRSISGVGDRAIRDAMEAIAAAMGYESIFIVEN